MNSLHGHNQWFVDTPLTLTKQTGINIANLHLLLPIYIQGDHFIGYYLLHVPGFYSQRQKKIHHIEEITSGMKGPTINIHQVEKKKAKTTTQRHSGNTTLLTNIHVYLIHIQVLQGLYR